MRAFIALGAALLLVGCSSTSITATPTPVPTIVLPTTVATLAPTPTAQVIYVTPAPTLVPIVTDPPTPAPAVGKPYTVTTKSDKVTTPFLITADSVTIKLTNKATAGCAYALSGVFLYPKGEKNVYEGQTQLDGCGSTTTDVIISVPGEYYYLNILVANAVVTVTVTPDA